MKVIEDGLIFECTGYRIYTHNNIVGICPGLSVSEGYDGGVPHENFTQEEREELANYMIELWTKFKTSGPESNPNR